MRFRYVGPEDQVTIFGVAFKHGEPVSVVDPAAVYKLSHHPHFTPADDEAGNLMGPTNAHQTGADYVRVADSPRPRRRRNANG